MESVIPQGQVDVMIFAAHGPHLRGLRTTLGERFDGKVGGLHVTAKTVGVGLAAAGPSAGKRLFQLHPRVVIHLGTCGLYPTSESGDADAQFQPNDVIVASQVHLVAPSRLMGQSKFPPPMQTRLDPTPGLSTALSQSGARAHYVPVASALGHTIDRRVGSEIFRTTGARAENLEAFAVAQACAYAETPYACVMAATHQLGAAGNDDQKKFERDGTLAAAEVVLNWLARGAVGIPHR